MSSLLEHQFEILPTADALDGFVFGIGGEVSVNSFDPGENSWTTQTTESSRRGNRNFGRDVRAAKTWLWESHVNQYDVPAALDTLEAFSSAWSPEDLMLEPGEQTAIRYRVGDRYRRVFGRPRRFAAPPSNQILSGYVPVTHDFELVDGLTYDDEETVVDLETASAADGGGWVFPVTFPVTTLPSSTSGAHRVMVGGRSRAYPRIRFFGPWTNPVLQADGWSLRWNGAIATGRWVEVDARPWALTVLNESGASVVSGLPPRTYLEDIWFAPGAQHEVRLGGNPGPGAHAQVGFRNAWDSF